MPEEDQALNRQLFEIENDLRDQPSLCLDRVLALESNHLEQTPRVQVRLKLLRVQCLIQLEYFTDAREILLEARTLINSREDLDLAALFQSLLGRLKYESCDPAAGLQLCEEALKVLGEEPIDPHLALTLFDTRILAAFCCVDICKLADAIQYLLYAIQIQQRFGIDKGQLAILHCLGRMYVHLGRIDDAKECALAAIRLSPKNQRFSYSHYLLATCHLLLGQIPECLDACAASFIDSVSASVTVKARLTVARAFSRMGEFSVAHGHLANAFRLAEQMHLDRDLFIIKLTEAGLQEESGAKESSLRLLMELATEPPTLNVLRFRYQWLSKVASVQQELGMHEEATRTFSELVEMRYDTVLLNEHSTMLHEHDMNSLHSLLNLPPLIKGVDSLIDIVSGRSAMHTVTLHTISSKIKSIEDAAPSELGETLHEISMELQSLIREVTMEGEAEEKTVEDRIFRTSLLKINPTFTSSELKVCALIREDKSSARIAYELGTSVRTVDTHRSRIRKKLGLSNSENLRSFLLRI